MKSVENQSYLTQARRLRAIAIDALKHYQLDVKSIQFIKYSANAIYKVTDTNHREYVLRIHAENNHTQAAIVEEMHWLQAIASNSDLIVPSPLKTKQDDCSVICQHPCHDGARVCDILSWLPGRRCWKSINKNYAYALGKLIGRVQSSGQNFQSQHRHYWDAEGLVGTGKATFHNVEQLTGVTQAAQYNVTQARRLVYKMLKSFECEYPSRSGLIHADMQPNNILVHRGQYAVIDFDDCGVGLYGTDLAVALFAFEYVIETQDRNDYSVLKDALLEGYSQIMPLDNDDINMLPTFLLARKLAVLGWLEIRKTNPKLQLYFNEALHRAIDYAERHKLC